MKAITLILSIAFSASLFAQNPNENQVDAKGRKQGPWKKYDNNNFLVYTGSFKDDVPQGTFRYFYGTKDTVVKCIMTFKNAGKESYALMFHFNGNIMGKGKYLNQLKDSVWSYYDESGKLISTDVYVKDKKNGLCKTYYQSGKLYGEVNYKDGMREGLFKEYFEDSKPKTESTYYKDKLDGKTTHWYPNGKIAAQGMYRGGVKHLIWNYNKSDGTAEPREVYKMGQLLEGKAAENFLKNPVVEPKKTDPGKGSGTDTGTKPKPKTGGTKTGTTTKGSGTKK